MKFLCVSCDEPMKLIKTNPPDRGSMTVVFRCPTCEHQIAMLTNHYETELVGSLGVKIGGKSVSEESPASDTPSSCPFSHQATETQGTAEPSAAAASSEQISWHPDALKRLQNIPEFVRPMAKQGIDKMALEKGYTEIDEQVLDEAKDLFGM